MASRPTITGRATSLAHAFVHAIIPREVDAAAQASLYRAAGINERECVYCGALATDLDHLRGLVKAGRPSGHFHTTNNLVPSCGPCNQSKGAADWKQWMLGQARGSPIRKGIADIHERIERLEAFERQAGKVDATSNEALRDIVGPELWDRYWQRLDELKALMVAAQREAIQIEQILSGAQREPASMEDVPQ
ncbi:HNH endonuclease [Aminobacter sp. MSH1]|uniref:HNH endonuclease n=1 Tax=Aminobacter sp. MSH1 TaxID=374606 RepID=UPI000D396E11|nr:HNH endonuclease signature motif containing protein [Aminobacter sp. MSH1]AWC22228.1 HNH endonuclease [Aminobacter sp. MSH1]